MANNGSRELILQRIRSGLKTQIPVPPPMSDEAVIFCRWKIRWRDFSRNARPT